MPYIGRAATNAGSVNYLDDISSGFDGSDTTFTCAVKGTTITPGQENVYIYLDGVFQHPSDAYSISGSTITFTEAPVNGTDFTAYVAGEGAYLDDGTVSTAKLDDDAVTASKLDDDGTGFQVGDLGVGGSLTSGDKLTVTGRLRASGGIIGDRTGDLTGNVTGNASGTAATVTGATQSAITSVGTLTGLASSGTIVLGDLDIIPTSSNVSVIKHDSGSGSLTLQGDQVNIKNRAGNETGLSYNDGGGVTLSHNSKATSSSADTTFKIETTSGTSIFPILDFVSSHNSVGGKIRQDGSDVISFDNSQNATFAGELRVDGGQASIYGAEGGNAVLELNSDEADDNADRWQMYVTANNNYLKWRHYGTGSWVDRLWLSSATDNWAFNIIGNSPYGMQITTTASNSSSHDMFKIKRGDGTACFEVYGDGNVYGTNEFISDYGFRSKGTSGAAPTGDDHHNVPIKMVAYRKTVSSTDVSNGYIDFDTDIYRDNIISGTTNHFGYAASNNNNIGYNPGYGHSLHFYAGGTCRLYFGGSVVQNDKMGIVLFFHGSTG